MSDFNKIIFQLQESVSSDIMFEMLESIGTMMIELKFIKEKLEDCIENDEVPTAINEMDLTEDFNRQLGIYNNLSQDLQSVLAG